MSLLDMRPRGAGGGSGGAPVDATYITQIPNATLTNEQALSLLASGLLKNTTATGILSIATQGTDYYAPGGIDVAITDGGTGQSTAQAAINALTAVSGATNEHVLTKDTVSGNAIWKAAAGGSSLPVADTQTIVMGSADNTKLLRFEVDGFTAGATRILTPPNADIIIAGQDFANLFTAHQTVTVATASAHGVTLKTSDDNTTNNLLRILSSANVQNFYITPTAILSSDKLGSSGDEAFRFNVTNSSSANFLMAFNFEGNKVFTVGRDSFDVPQKISFKQNNATFSNNYGIRFNTSNWGGVSFFVTYLGNSNSTYRYALIDDNNQEIVSTYVRSTSAGKTQFTSFNSGVVPLNGLISDTTNNAVSNALILDHERNGATAGADGIGVGLLLRAESTVNATMREVGRIQGLLATATDASRKGRVVYTAYDTAEREGIRIEASGTAPMLGVLGAAAIARQAHIVDPSGGGTVDAEARTAINAILVALESFGFLATS